MQCETNKMGLSPWYLHRNHYLHKLQYYIHYFGIKYGELYKKTLKREQLIRDLGYNLLVMWEYDWNKKNKSIKILQRKFRNFINFLLFF